jgi:hypothetical protein
MRIKFIYGFVVLIVVTACKNNTEINVQQPKQLIEKEKMVDILYDMALISAAKGVNRRLMEREGVVPEQYVYEKHNIDSITFSENNTYYSHDITSYEAMYKLVRLRIEKMKDSFNLKISEEKGMKDSLSRKVRREQDSLRKNRKENPKSGNSKPRLKPEIQRKRVDSSVQLKNQAP